MERIACCWIRGYWATQCTVVAHRRGIPTTASQGIHPTAQSRSKSAKNANQLLKRTTKEWSRWTSSTTLILAQNTGLISWLRRSITIRERTSISSWWTAQAWEIIKTTHSDLSGGNPIKCRAWRIWTLHTLLGSNSTRVQRFWRTSTPQSTKKARSSRIDLETWWISDTINWTRPNPWLFTRRSMFIIWDRIVRVQIKGSQVRDS